MGRCVAGARRKVAERSDEGADPEVWVAGTDSPSAGSKRKPQNRMRGAPVPFVERRIRSAELPSPDTELHS
jgi:hypothetical protein